MKIEFGAGELCLVKNHPLRLVGARGLLITCTAGIVWITQDGEADDIFLSLGEQYSLQRDGLVLVESIEHGTIRIAQLPATSPLNALVSRILGSSLAIAPAPGKTSRTRFA